MLWTEGRWPMGSSPLFQSGGRPAEPSLSGNASTSSSRGEVTKKESAGHQEEHGVSFGHGSTVTMAETNPVSMTQAEGHVAAHLRTRGRRHAPNAEAFCPNLTVIPHPMQ